MNPFHLRGSDGDALYRQVRLQRKLRDPGGHVHNLRVLELRTVAADFFDQDRDDAPPQGLDRVDVDGWIRSEIG